MRIHLISLLRNERDILPSFLSHASALFDSADLVDHMSVDGSGMLVEQFCADLPGWSFGQLNTEAYLQSELSTTLMRRAFADGADAVVFLDADEFLHGVGRDEMERLVTLLDEARMIGAFLWRNCAPRTFQSDFRVTHPSLIGDMSVHRKIFIPGWLYRAHGDQIRVNQGAHSVRISGQPFHDVVNVGEMLHFPLRSERQFIRKVVSTFLSQREAGGAIAPHVEQMIRIIGDGKADDGVITAMAMQYSQFDNGIDISAGAGREFQIPGVALSPHFTIDAIEQMAGAIPRNSEARWSGERTVTIGHEAIAL